MKKTVHVVELGDGISSIAQRYGFFPGTLWEDGDNRGLRERRSNPNTLSPGDEVAIPALRQKTLALRTGTTHRFRRKGVPAVFSLQVFAGDQPRAHQSYELTADGRRLTGVTDGDGALFQYLPPDAEEALLVIGPDRCAFRLRFGHLPPINEPA